MTPAEQRAWVLGRLAYWAAPPWALEIEGCWPQPWGGERMASLIERYDASSTAWRREGWSGQPSDTEGRRRAATALREVLEEAFVTGLALRRWRWLIPLAVERTEDLDDWFCFYLVHALRALVHPERRVARLDGPQAGGWSVCTGCGLVFRLFGHPSG